MSFTVITYMISAFVLSWIIGALWSVTETFGRAVADD